jgi:hypothetical protein
MTSLLKRSCAPYGSLEEPLKNSKDISLPTRKVMIVSISSMLTPKSPTTALDESLASMAAQECLTHQPRKGKSYTPLRTQIAAPILGDRPLWWDEEEN